MIREATKSDTNACIAMGLEFLDMAGFEPVIEKVEQTITSLIDGQSLLVSGDPATGMIGGILYPHYFNNEMIAQELFWWVSPLHRGSGIKLLDAFEDWAKRRGADKIMMISLEKNDVSRIYKKRGYQALEHTFERQLWQ